MANRGRPKGSKNKPKSNNRSGYKPNLQWNNENSQKYIEHSMHLAALAETPLDLRSEEQVKQRIQMFYTQCMADEMKPGVAAFALSLGIHRKTLWGYVHTDAGVRVLTPTTKKLIQQAYNMIDTINESMMVEGDINPVAGIFLMKNNHLYQDESAKTVYHTTLPEGQSLQDLEKKYLTAAESMLLEAGGSLASAREREKESIAE